jgi:autotransporter-associated beta strand protein
MDANGSGGSTLVLGASQSIASLTGAASSNVTLGSNTLTIGTSNSSTTYAGRITGGSSSALVKDGNSTQVLSGSNTGFSGSTTVNAGTLQLANANALGSNNAAVTVNGGTLLVSTDDAINGKQITLNGTSTTVATLAFSGNYSGSIGKLTLSANSIIDLGQGNIGLQFADMAMGLYSLSIYNWSGTTQYGTTYGTGTDQLYFNGSYNLANVKFYSGAVGSDSFVATGFDMGLQNTSWDNGLSGQYIIPVPEPETWATGILLLAASAWWLMKKTRKAKA